MTKTLVAYYSRTDTSLKVAKDLAETLGADLDRIELPTHRRGSIAYALSALEAVAKGVPSIRTRLDPGAYDLVVLGSPVWAGTMSAPMRSYLFMHRAELPRRLGFFAVMGGRGAERAMLEMKMLCGAEQAPSQAFLERDVRSNMHRQGVAGLALALSHRYGTANASTGAAA